MTERPTSPPDPIWRRTGPAIPVDDEHVLDPDVVVAGAGLTGLATAVMLARAGRRVAVCEAREAGAVTTGGTTGKLSLLQGSVYSAVREHAGDAALRAYAAAHGDAARWVRDAARDADGVVRDAPAITYSTTAEGDAALEREAEALAASGTEGEWSATDRTGLPFAVTRALRMEAQAALHPRRLLAVLVAELRRRGGTVVERCRVTGVDDAPAGIGVRTTRGRLSASALVVATGAPVVDRAAFFARLEASRSVVAAYRVDAAPEGMHLSVDSEPRSLRTAEDVDGGPLLLVGGGSYATGRADGPGEILDETDRWTAEWFPGARRTTWWAAQDYRTPTRLLHADAEPGFDGRVFAATGYGKWGMTGAVAAALAVSGDIVGAGPSWAAALRAPQVGLRAVAEAGGANAAVAGEMAAGWAKALTAGRSEAPAEGEGRLERRGARPVAVSRVDGEVCAVSGICTHLGGVLRWNRAERTWDCPLHASRFSADGRVLEGPAVEDLAAVERP